jgi:hypothetical protein
LRLDDYPAGKDRRDRIDWRWRAGPWVSPEEFGDPTQTTDYELCVYDGTGRLVVGASIPAGAGWVRRGALEYRYADATLAHAGVRKLGLRASGLAGDTGAADRAALRLQARGKADTLATTTAGNFPDLPGFPLELGPDGLRAQLANSLGYCWENRFAANVARNQVDGSGAQRFRARSD